MKKLRLWTVTLLLHSFLFLPIGTARDLPFEDVPFDTTNIPEPVPPPEEVRDFFDLSSFWQQWINIEGFPVLGSANVSPYAVKETAWLLGQMFRHRSDILKILARGGQTFTMIAHNEVVSDIPELRDDPLLFYWNVRARGGLRKLMGSSEEMVLSNAFVPIHEMAHATLDIMYQQLDPPFDNRLGTVYNAAMEKGLWQGTFFALNKIEYWAEGVGVWFHANNQNPVTTRDALKAYDPSLALLIAEVFGDHDWRYTPIEMRTRLPHLQGFDPQSAPREVEWPPGVVDAYEELRNPAINERNEWVNLPPYDPSLIPNLHELRNRGRDDDVWTYMLVVSTIDAEILLYWVYADGTETLVHRFPPNPRQIDLFPCLVGDILLAKDPTGRNIAVFQAVEKTGRVLIAPALNFITPGLSKFSGDNQGGVPGAILANSFVIEVRDESFSMLEGISVTFTVTAGDGTLSVMHTTTDENGRAESTLTLGPNLGTNAVSVSAAGIEHPVTFNAVAEAGVHIPNTNLRAAIETALGKAQGDLITPSEMATLTRLDSQNANISDLTGLEFATNLTSLNLGHVYEGGRPINSNSISNISPLAGLTYLTELRLGFNLIADISALAGLTNLTWLDLTGNSVSNIAPVASLTKLTQLDLDGNAISTISPVAGLTNLTFLDIWGTSISDISPVAGLTNLTSLGLGHNNISDISPVAGLTNLTGLYLPSNHITDISSLSGLTNLKTLWLNRNSISDLSSLVANTGLGSGDTVDVRENRLSYQSLHTHIPALQSRGIAVEFNNRTPHKIRIVSGNIQQGLPGAALEEPFVVEVQDQNGVAFEGVPIIFTIAGGAGTLSTTSVTTDSNGRAESTLALGQNPGTNTVEVAVTGIEEKQTFNAEGIRVPKTLEIISGKDQEGLPGEALEKPFVVEVRDADGSVLEGILVTFTITAGGGTLSATSMTTDANGRAKSTLTLGPNLGTNTVTVSVTGTQEKQTFNAEGIRIPKKLEIISGKDQEGLPGDALEKAFVVEVRDEFDKPLPGAQVTFTVTSGDGTLSEISVTTDSNGRAESTLTLGPNPGTNTVTVSVTGSQETRTFNAEGVRIPKTLEIISGVDQDGLPGEALEKAFVVEVRDQTDKPLPGVEVTFTVTTGSGTVQPEIATTDENGRAESTLTLGPNPGTNTVTVSVTGSQETRTFTAEGSRIPKKLEIISGVDQAGLPGDVLEKAFVVEVRDQTDNPLPGVEVTFTVTAGDGTLSEISVTTDSNGRAESILTLGPNPGTNTVTVSVTGSHETRTFNAEGIRIPKKLEIVSGKDQEGLPGEALEKAFVVEVRDQTDKPLPGVEVTFTVTAGGGTVQPEIATTDENGRAESTLTLGSTPGTNTVRVSVEGNTQAVATLTIETVRVFALSIPAGTHLIHIPLAVNQINGEDATIETVGDLYNALGDEVNFIITVGDDGGWKTYLGDISMGTVADAEIEDDTGLIVVMSDAKTLELVGDALGAGGDSMINIDVGNNLVGVPLKPSTGLSMISDLLGDGVGAIAVSKADGMGFHTIREPGQDGDAPIVGGVGYLVVYIGTEATSIPIVGSAWKNTGAVSAAPAVAFDGTHTPVLYVEGGVMDEFNMLARAPELRVTVKNLSTGASLDTVLGTELSETAYSGTFVELSRHAAKAGDVLEIVAHSPNPFVGVRPVPQIVVSAEQVLTSRISLPDMELYEIPSESELLANYPNPFNPETWIPYRLAKAAEVTLDIYDTNGRLVRTIDVGFKPAAVYESRASAIYWDGRNANGESVASGVYFYQLQAGDHSATRRMVIVK